MHLFVQEMDFVKILILVFANLDTLETNVKYQFVTQKLTHLHVLMEMVHASLQTNVSVILNTVEKNAKILFALEKLPMIPLFVMGMGFVKIPILVFVKQLTLEINAKLQFVIQNQVQLLVQEMVPVYLQITAIAILDLQEMNAQSQFASENYQMIPMFAQEKEIALHQILVYVKALTMEMNVNFLFAMDSVQPIP
jgi:hypothetical protein